MVGNRTRIKIVKNKVAPPFKQAEVDIMFGEGISKEGSALDIAADLDIVNKSGAWYSLEGDRLGQGRKNAKQFLKENPKMYLFIENKIREHYNLPLIAQEQEGSHQTEKENEEDKVEV
jgi:recombination protein RecA